MPYFNFIRMVKVFGVPQSVFHYFSQFYHKRKLEF
ncbi:hypothetical protein VIBNISFn118_20015 [Vibrio nigripulchritudo SFn118]|nr:hypothetical protein VIBNISFn118_20015 [Vibrio nigripulchritudo SFn118]